MPEFDLDTSSFSPPLEASSVKPFDLKSCRSKLEDHYQKTATVPTSVWSKKSVVDIHQIYTRLSWVKEEQTPTGTRQSEVEHYSDLFIANKKGVIPKRILVQGQTGIGKSTFVKKLLVDWVEVSKGTGEKQAAVLKNFELVVAVNLKEVSKCQSLVDVIRMSNVFAKEDKYMTEGLVDYVTNNQEKVLLIFDGYDEYRSGLDSEIYEIFSGNSLRNCCVLITTRISKADELRGGEDLHAEITGFSEVDMEFFMRRFLNSREVLQLQNYLDSRNLMDLAKVPLLLLFFCILWKERQSTHFPGNKTKLYVNIIQFILNHSQCKQSPPQYLEVISFKEILSEIGKIALQALLNNDHLFEYSQLSDSVCCDESVLIGLLQITEYSETLRPVGLVSFIHKSIQEFLAAWYITYRCIPEGRNLGEIGVKLEKCLALENVFQFVCGLSKEGSSVAMKHLESVRISDPLLDLSKAIPDLESETDVPLSDVKDCQRQFGNLVLNSFEEVESQAEVSRACLDCLGGILLVSRPLPDVLLQKAKDLNSSLVLESHLFPSSVESVRKVFDTFLGTEFLDDFLTSTCSFMDGRPSCGFSSVICFHNGQVHFYFTHLTLWCRHHCSSLINETVVPSHSANSFSGQPYLKFLKTLNCSGRSDDSVSIVSLRENILSHLECLALVIKHATHLRGIFILDIDDSICHLLEQVSNPSRCSLCISHCKLTSTGAGGLASLLPKFENVSCLQLSSWYWSAEAVRKLVSAIKHRTPKCLQLGNIHLTLAVAEALSQSLPELSALETLEIAGFHSLQQEEMKVLFRRLNRPSSIKVLGIAHFSARGSLAPLAKSLCFFPCLVVLNLQYLNMCEADLSVLLKNLKFTPDLQRLYLRGNPLGHAIRSMIPYLLKQQNLEEVHFRKGDCSQEDFDYVQNAVKERRLQLRIEPCLFG